MSCSCEAARDLFEPYLEEALGRPERSAVREHLVACAACRNEASLRDPAFLFAAMPAEEVSAVEAAEILTAVRAGIALKSAENRIQSVPRRGSLGNPNRNANSNSNSNRRPAAAAAAVAAVVLLVWTSNPGGSGQPRAAMGTGTTSPAANGADSRASANARLVSVSASASLPAPASALMSMSMPMPVPMPVPVSDAASSTRGGALRLNAPEGQPTLPFAFGKPAGSATGAAKGSVPADSTIYDWNPGGGQPRVVWIVDRSLDI